MIELTNEYVTKDAENVANEFLRDIEPTQLRRFYDDFKVLERKLNQQQNPSDEWFKKEMLPYIKFVGTKIVYSAGRKKSSGGGAKIALVPKGLKDHFINQITEIKTINCFKHFLMHYQAIIAYFTYLKFESENKGSTSQSQQESHKKFESNHSSKQRR
ncbi:MAG: type III-A CRISPR-associated protein Csm2 [Spirochaetes bacterium]|nr:type III-A CRISPR-associated protein Csm2 [Spirochaetota bacterium]